MVLLLLQLVLMCCLLLLHRCEWCCCCNLCCCCCLLVLHRCEWCCCCCCTCGGRLLSHTSLTTFEAFWVWHDTHAVGSLGCLPRKVRPVQAKGVAAESNGGEDTQCCCVSCGLVLTRARSLWPCCSLRRVKDESWFIPVLVNLYQKLTARLHRVQHTAELGCAPVQRWVRLAHAGQQ
jgi:hypothetical protein